MGLYLGEGYQAFNPPQTLGERDQLGLQQYLFDQGVMVDLKGDHGTKAAGIALHKLMIGVILQAGIKDLAHQRVRFKPAGDREGVVLLAVESHPQGLDAADGQPGVLRAQYGADGVLMVVHPIGQFRILDAYQAGDGVVVARKVLGGAVDRDIGSQVERAQQIGGQEGVVGDQQQVVLATQAGQGCQVGKFQQRIGEGFDEQGPGGGCDGGQYCGCVAGVHIGERQAVLAEDLVEQAAGAAIQVFGDDQVVTCFEQQQQVGDGRHAGGVGKAPDAAVQSGDAVFQGLTGGVAGAAVIIPGALAESRVAEGGGLVDRDGHRPGSRIPLQPDLNCLC